ncbi:hypothetical protein ARMGADRAFT_91925 [Armillaria gallica]|uniref:Uncharacterized protein n=1 Tax=Armillaria gallica TaxID=47427 RepID=A0A2H3DZF5_ARMGA|nr:hypothetical protein ARMGADRAFT_91925 [Armillaria gallica]
MCNQNTFFTAYHVVGLAIGADVNERTILSLLTCLTWKCSTTLIPTGLCCIRGTVLRTMGLHVLPKNRERSPLFWGMNVSTRGTLAMLPLIDKISCTSPRIAVITTFAILGADAESVDVSTLLGGPARFFYYKVICVPHPIPTWVSHKYLPPIPFLTSAIMVLMSLASGGLNSFPLACGK